MYFHKYTLRILIASFVARSLAMLMYVQYTPLASEARASLDNQTARVY
jgi:hypothetical protein